MYSVVCFKIVINVELPKYILFTRSLMCYYCIGSFMFVDLYIYCWWCWSEIISPPPRPILVQVHTPATLPQLPITHWTGGWMGPRLVQTFGRRNNLLPLLANAPQFLGNPAHSLVTILTTLARRATYFHCIPSFVSFDDIQHCQENRFYQLLSS